MPDKKTTSQEFRDYVADIIPLHHDRVLFANKHNPTKRLNPPFQSFSLQHTYEKVAPNELIEYARPGIKEKELPLLKKGHYSQHAVLDLHGLKIDQAIQALTTFIKRCRLQGIKCVRIIHGKGQRSENPALLKNLTNQWLRQMPEILAFCSAKPKDGGAGAVYVLIKKYQ